MTFIIHITYIFSFVYCGLPLSRKSENSASSSCKASSPCGNRNHPQAFYSRLAHKFNYFHIIIFTGIGIANITAMDNINNNDGTIIDASDIGTLALSTVKNFSKRHRVITTSYLWGLTTLLLIALLGGGTKLTVDQSRQYNRIMTIALS